MRFKDQAIIVTGSTRGIGRAIAERLLSEGARVLVTDVASQENAGRAFADEHGDRVVFHVDDLTDPQAPSRIVAAAVDAFGKLDGVVNNAGIVPRSDIRTTTAELFRLTMSIDALAPLLMIQHALPHLEKTGGRVVNIGSINSWCGEPSLLAYSMAKGALMTMTRNLGDALGSSGVRINQINPGWVLTDNERRMKREAGFPDDWPDNLPREVVPAGRMTKPQELAASVVFFLSTESFPANGVVVDMEQHPILGRNPEKETK